MTRQQSTGKDTENVVRKRLERLGLEPGQPFEDGVDFTVFSPKHPNRIVRIQVKGRGAQQTNGRYRWFQLRTSENQRRLAEHAGLDPADAYSIKAAKCDVFVLVALKYNECWVFTTREILEIIDLNKPVYGQRRDNLLGHQKEMDLDILVEGQPLTERYRANLENFKPVLEFLK